MREKLARAIALGLGRRMMTFSEYLLLAWALSGAEMVDFACSLGNGMPVNEWVAGTLFIATWFFTWPICAICCEELASVKLHLAGWKGALWICFTVVAMLFGFGFLMQQITRFLFERATSEAWALAVQIAMVTLGLVLFIGVPAIKPLYQRYYKGEASSVDDERSDEPAAAVEEMNEIHDPEHGTGEQNGKLPEIAEEEEKDPAALAAQAGDGGDMIGVVNFQVIRSWV